MRRSPHQRVQSSDALLIVDSVRRRSSMSAEAHAGFLSFELSSRQQRIVGQLVLPATSRDTWPPRRARLRGAFDRGFNDTSSCRFLASDLAASLLGAPILSVVHVNSRADGTRQRHILRLLSHDGYAERFAWFINASCALRRRSRLDGEEPFSCRPWCENLPRPLPDIFAVRFHRTPSSRRIRLSTVTVPCWCCRNREVLDLPP